MGYTDVKALQKLSRIGWSHGQREGVALLAEADAGQPAY